MRIILFGVLLLVIFPSCQEESQRIKPKVQKLTEFVYASVSIEPQNVYDVYPGVNGIIEDVIIEENQVVSKGQTIIKITNSIPQTNVEKAQLNKALAEQNYETQLDLLKTMKQDIESAKLSYETDSINFKRQERLWSKNIGSQAEFEARKLKYELSKNNFEALSSKYIITEKEIKNQISTQIELAKASLKSSKANNQEFEIKSKIDGKVYAVYKNPGESVLIQEPIAKIGEKDTFLIEMEVDEVDIARLNVGQLVLINLDAYDEKVFEARIKKIFPQKNLRTQTFKIEASFIDSPKVLYPGLSGEANIVISERDEILTIPLEYLIEGNKVLTEEGEILVVTGIKDMKHVEIVSGIDSSTYIVKPE